MEPVIEIGRGLVRTLGQLQAQGQQIPEGKDPLSLVDFGRKSGK